MKKHTFLLLLFVSLLSLAKSQDVICLTPEYEDHCSDIVSHVFDDYIYLRSHVFSFKEEKEDISTITLKRNVLYIFNVCEENATDNMVIDLYDEKDSLLVSSVGPTGKNNKIITYYTTTGGRYNIAAHFPKKRKTCCLVMLGMITKNIEQYVSKNKLNK